MTTCQALRRRYGAAKVVFDIVRQHVKATSEAIQHALQDYNLWPHYPPRTSAIDIQEAPIDFPASFPKEWTTNVIRIDNQIPALFLSPDICRVLKGFMLAAKHARKVDALCRVESKNIKTQMDREAAEITVLEKKRDKLTRILEQFDNGDGEGRCEYSWNDVEDLEAEIDGKNKSVEDWQHRGRTMLDETHVKLERAWIEANMLSEMLDRPLQAAGVIPNDNQAWVLERPRLPYMLRYIYRAQNAADFPFLKEYLQREAATESRQDHQRNAKDLNPLAAAYDEFDICHWNRTVARADFDNMQKLLKYNDVQFRRQLEDEYCFDPEA